MYRVLAPPRHGPSGKQRKGVVASRCCRRAATKSRLTKAWPVRALRDGPQESCVNLSGGPRPRCPTPSPRRRRHAPPDHVQRCITRRRPGIPAIGLADPPRRNRKLPHDSNHVHLRRCQRTLPHRLAPPEALRSQRRAREPQRDANGDDTGPPLVRPGDRSLLRRLHAAVDIGAREGPRRAEGVQPQGVVDQAGQGRVGKDTSPGAAQVLGRYVPGSSSTQRSCCDKTADNPQPRPTPRTPTPT